ncbi:MAG: adenylate/guanylate cyclase domain-containing protein [Gammaproteobacteria bacterium]
MPAPPIPVAQSADSFAKWLASDARFINDTAQLDREIIARMHAAGLPVARYSIGMASLHPQVDGFSSVWERGGELIYREHMADEEGNKQLRDSPIYAVFMEGRGSRHRLLGAPPKNEYSILTELREKGMTDYMALALPLGDGTHMAMTLASDAPGGFEDAHIEILNALRNAFAARMEIQYLRYLTRVLMDTYVGPTAGRKVLAGAIKRGSSETIRAVIWFCDLKGFTALSEGLAAPKLLDTLNRYFEAMSTAIEAHDGEVLKFIGDAMLAIFQPGAGGDRDAAMRALAAAQQAVRALRDAGRESAPAVECGIALHFGDVLYGNVGGQRRLDFTVIGAAVNLASRLESLTRKLARPVVVSSSFAAVHGGEFAELGAHSFKGIARAETVFAP